jgi:DNA adenine methylase
LAPPGLTPAQRALPVLKWPGGKRFLASALAPVLRQIPYARYVEPFAGGASMYMALEPRRALLSDLNGELIHFYTVLRKDPEGIIRSLRRFKSTEDDYYRIRATAPRSACGRAARFYYLTRFSFNGIYRENRLGDFNVPFGGRSGRRPFDADSLRKCHRLLRRARLATSDFESIIEKATRNDLIYCDPPYTVAHNRNGFVRYNAQLFSWDDQRRLAARACAAAARGAYIVVSNANHKTILELYPSFSGFPIQRQSRVSAATPFRIPTTEVVLLSDTLAPWQHDFRRAIYDLMSPSNSAVP